MKLSSYHRQQGDAVGFNVADPEKIYISCIFSQNLTQARGVATFYPDAEVKLGGPALGTPNSLPAEAEHLMPDYDLYDIDYSLGFTTRGCPNCCPFCIVPQLEGSFTEYAPIKEFHHPDHRKLVLYDNNFLASKLWREKLDYIEEQGLRVNFNQGLDARLITVEVAQRLAELPVYNFHFNHRTYHFAWDLMKNSDRIQNGFQLMLDAGVNPRNLMVYVLVGFNTTHQEDMYRVNVLTELGMDPFIMKYNMRKDDPFLNHLARWVNKRLYKVFPFKDYDRLDRLTLAEVEAVARQ